MHKQKGFTIIELIVVIAIISLLSSIVVANVNGVRVKARDARRLAEMKQIQLALIMYFEKYGHYPYNTDNDCSGWDTGYDKSAGDLSFIQPLIDGGIMSYVPGDITSTSQCGGYRYYRYDGGYSCDASRGAFFVLGTTDMETTGNPHPSSPGWNCPDRNWQNEFDWVVGGYEK